MKTLDYIKDKYKTGQSELEYIKGYGRNDLARDFAALGFTEGVEIGTEAGKYARVLLDANPKLHLSCIDPWTVYDDGGGYKEVDQKQYDEYYRQAEERTKGFNCDLLRAFSRTAVVMFPDESLDFVYIDGNHRLDYVVEDLVLWTPKVKPGGIVAGHDFLKLTHQHYSHVPYAVLAYQQAYFIPTVYILDNKNKATRTEAENRQYDRIKSWFFIR